MKIQGKIKGFILHSQLISTMCFALFFSSCNNQPSDDSKSEQEWVDPLFFVEGQLCQHLREIFQDAEGNLWFGTNVYGLMRFDGDTLEYFDEKHGLAGGRITGIVEDKSGNLWFGTAGGLSKYTPSPNGSEVTFTNYSEAEGLVEKEIWSLMLDQEGTFWVGTLNGVYQFDGNSFEFFELPKTKGSGTTVYHDRITRIIQDHSGGIWFGRDGHGATRLYQGQFQEFTRENGLSDNTVHGLLEDQRGNVWIGTMNGGLNRWTEGKIHTYPFANPIKGWEIGALYEDSQLNIWFASENHGVYQYDPGSDSFTNYHKEQGLPTDGILSIFEDRSGRYWMGGWGGLFRYYPNHQYTTDRFVPVTVAGPWN